MDMMSLRRRIMGAEKTLLPKEYQQVEYLESTGTQYIELTFGFDLTDEIEVRGAITQSFSDKYLICPKTWNTNNNRFAMLGGLSGKFIFALGNLGTPNTRLTPEMNQDALFHTATYSNKVFTMVDTGSVADFTDGAFGSTTANLRLFFGVYGNTHGKIAYYHHKKLDGTEVNLIPCYRKADSKPGMYDLVSGEFYTNAGSGEFIVGSDV